MKTKKVKLYKFKHEVIPYCGAGLAPRNYLGNRDWKILMAERTSEIGGKFCEICGSVDKLDFHESFEIKNCVFILKGMFWLCRKCHHNTHIGGNDWHYPNSDLSRMANVKLFKAKEEAFYFNTTLDVSVDYSWLSKYNIDYLSVENEWTNCKRYNQKYIVLRFLISCITMNGRNKRHIVYEHFLHNNFPKDTDKYMITVADCMRNNFKDFFIEHKNTFLEKIKLWYGKDILPYLNITRNEDLPFGLRGDIDDYISPEPEIIIPQISQEQLLNQSKKQELREAYSNGDISLSQYIQSI